MQKNLEKLRFGLVALGLLILAVSLDGQNIFVWFGVKPNLILGVLIGAVLLVDINWYFSLLVIGVAGIEFYPGFGRLAVAMLVAGSLNFWLKKKFLADGVVAISILALVGTAVFYLVEAPVFIFKYPGIFLLEAVYNLVVGALVFGLLRYLFDEE